MADTVHTLTDLQAVATKYQRPQDYTDHDFAVLREFDPNWEREARKRKHLARLTPTLTPELEAELEIAAMVAKTKSAASPPVAAAERSDLLRDLNALFTKAETDDTGDLFADLITVSEKHGTTPAPMIVVSIFAHCLQAISDYTRTTNAKIAALEARPEESKSGVSYGGVHRVGQKYSEGVLVTRKGGLWLCTAATTTTIPGASNDWKLIVKAGGAVGLGSDLDEPGDGPR